MKPPKPRITKPKLKWKLNRRGTAWMALYRVTWTEAGKRKEKTITLDWQGDPQRLDDLYWQCASGRHEAQERPARYTWAEIVRLWREDPKVQKRLADGTKRSYRREMDSLLDKNAGKEMRNTTRKGLRSVHGKLAETPRKADWRIQIVSLLWNYAKNKQDWPLGENPASGFDLYGVSRPFEPWPEWMVKAAENAPPAVKTAVYVLRGTGQRPSAAVSMRFDQFAGSYMTVTDEKGDQSFEIYCPESLRLYINGLQKTGAHLMARNLTQPLGYDAVQKQFASWRKSLGEEAKSFTLHGLRKLAIIELAEAGATDAEIQAVTGQSAEMVAYYRKRASRKKLSRTAQRRRDQNKNGT